MIIIGKKLSEEKGLRVNAGKPKIMICDTLVDLVSCQCAVCHTGIGCKH